VCLYAFACVCVCVCVRTCMLCRACDFVVEFYLEVSHAIANLLCWIFNVLLISFYVHSICGIGLYYMLSELYAFDI